MQRVQVMMALTLYRSAKHFTASGVFFTIMTIIAGWDIVVKVLNVPLYILKVYARSPFGLTVR